MEADKRRELIDRLERLGRQLDEPLVERFRDAEFDSLL